MPHFNFDLSSQNDDAMSEGHHFTQSTDFPQANREDAILSLPTPSTLFSNMRGPMHSTPSPAPQSGFFPSMNAPSSSHSTPSPNGSDNHSASLILQSTEAGCLAGKVNPKFVEGIAKKMGLKPGQLHDLHFLRKVAEKSPSLSTSDTASRIYQLACQFKIQNQLEALVLGSGATSPASSAEVLNELQIRLDDSFKLTSDQRKNIRRVAQDSIYKSDRVTFKEFHHDVQAKLTSKPDQYQLTNVMDNPAREAILASTVKTICGQVRNGFRQDIRESVIGPKKTTLTNFTIQSATKYRQGMLTDAIRSKLIVHNALLRRFAFEHQDYLNLGEPEEEPQITVQSTAQKRTFTGQVKAMGRVANGLDFWSRVDQWFAAEIVKRGGNRDLMGEVWRPYCEETIRWDNDMFDNPAPSASAGPSALGVQPAAPVSTAAPGPSVNPGNFDDDILNMV